MKDLCVDCRGFDDKIGEIEKSHFETVACEGRGDTTPTLNMQVMIGKELRISCSRKEGCRGCELVSELAITNYFTTYPGGIEN